MPFEEAPMGTTGLETAFAAVYTELVLPGVLPLALVVDRMSSGAALLDLPLPAIRAGRPADFCLVDLAAEWDSDGTVEKDLSPSWDIGDKVEASLPSDWSILDYLEIDIEQLWNVNEAYILDPTGRGVYMFEVLGDRVVFEVPGDLTSFPIASESAPALTT